MPQVPGAVSSTIVLFLAVSLLVFASIACSPSEPLKGTELTARSIAPDFELTDQFGSSHSLAEHSGNVVLLTFLYTHCPDICPVVADHVRNVHRLLDDRAGEVSLLIVSVDPERDTAEAALSYSEAWQMEGSWSYLVGAEEELSPVWEAYYVDPVRIDSAEDSVDSGGGDSNLAGVDALYEGVKLRYTVTHSAPVYLIDRTGVMRVLFTLPMDPADIAHDVQVLLKE